MRLIRSVASNGGVLVLAESFFDETNTHKTDKRLCVGGYIFLEQGAAEQAARWKTMIDKWGLKYFHMVDCAHNAEGFAHLSKPECDMAAREAIQIIKDTASAGVCVTVLESDYLEIIPQLKFFGSAYDSCARDVLTGVSAWMDRADFQGHMHYWFEEGAETDSHASWSILQMMNDPQIRRDTRYGGHTFTPKVRSPGVQAADILAWHAGTDCRRSLNGEPMRKDFASLCDIPHSVVHLTRQRLTEMAHLVSGTLAEAGITQEMADKFYELERQSRTSL